MSDILRVGKIDESKLDGKKYFESLVNEAQRVGMFSQQDSDKIKLDCVSLLAMQVDKRYEGKSTSVGTDNAENMFNSMLYTISVALKQYPDADSAAQALLDKKIEDIFFSGSNLIKRMIKVSLTTYRLVRASILETENETYNDTLKDGLTGFFKIYDAEYSADKIKISADYPLCVEITDLVGIEFIEKYIQSLFYENQFCALFSADDINSLMYGYKEDYDYLVVNIFEQVLISALGRVLTGQSAQNLLLTKDDVKKAEKLFEGKSLSEIDEIVRKASLQMFEELEINNSGMRAYIDKALTGIVNRINSMVLKTSLIPVFIIPEVTEDSSITVSFGDKMEDYVYSEIVTDLIACADLNEKLSIIKSEISSLRDLNDVMIDAELTSGEIEAVLENLNVYEIAALRKKHALGFVNNGDGLYNQELVLITAIEDFVERQSPEYKTELRKITDRLKIEE